MTNSGLGCGCSVSSSNESDLGFLTPSVTSSPKMTATLTTGRQTAVVNVALDPAQLWPIFLREGMAFGAAWASSLEQGRTVPAQWNAALEAEAQKMSIPVSSTGVVASTRDAFVTGFDLGIRIVMGGNRLSFSAPDGRVYQLGALLNQGRVIASEMFNQTRPAVVSFVSTPSIAPAAPGVGWLTPPTARWFTGNPKMTRNQKATRQAR